MNKLRDIDFLDYMGLQESQYLEPASTWLDELLHYDEFRASGDLLPWEKTHSTVQYRPGEVSLWGGYNGSGKSLLLSQCMVHWMQNSKAVIASLEMKPRDTLNRMLLQTGQNQKPTNEDKTQFTVWTADRLWIYDQLDQVPFDRILGMIRYSAKELGVKHIVIDSLMKCGIDDSDYDGQKNFVDHLCWIAKNENVHIHLVAHMRKRGSENEVPGKFDFFGSSAITNLVDQVMVIWRNKEKEIVVGNGGTWDGGTSGYDCDVLLRVVKNRHSGVEDDFGLFFAPGFNQYNSSPRWQDTRINYRSAA